MTDFRAAVLLLTLSIPSCGLDDDPPRDLAEFGIQGRVVLETGINLEPTTIGNTTDPEVCGEKQSLEDVVFSREDRALGNVIVALIDVPAERVSSVEPQTLTLDNVGCRFEPHAAVLTAGSTVVATNSDAVLHTTHLYGPAEMNLSLPVVGATSSRTLERSGLYVVKCDVHGWMQAFIRVAEHGFQAVTDADGQFRMDSVPSGNYTMELWHEKLGTMQRAVEVKDGAPTWVEIEFAQEVSP